MQQIGKWIRNRYQSFERWRRYSNSQLFAKQTRKKINESKKVTFVDKKLIKKIQEYCSTRYGNSDHWHWLALYSEIMEEFIEGWLPNDIYELELIPRLNPPKFTYLSTLKSYDHHVFSGFAVKPVAIFINGIFFDGKGSPLSEREFLQKMKSYRAEVVLKRDSAPSGKGILFKHSDKVAVDDFDKRFSYVIQPLFKQHSELAKGHEKSVNTVRISTYLSHSGEVSVKHLLLRLGRGGSRIVNAGADDIDIYIDREGRALKNAVNGIGIKMGDTHPDNGIPYKNLRVPSMELAISECKKSHLKFPYLRFIAWDVYVDEEERPHMIEWNTVNPQLWVHEAHMGPLWSKDEIDDILKLPK